MRSKVAEKFSKVHYVAITTDSWTSQATISYLTITVHEIDEKWNLLSWVLQTRKFTQPHDGEHIKEIIR